MTVTATPYGQFQQDLLAGVHNITADTTKAALLTSGYTPNFDTHVSFADVVANEVSGTGYTAGGNALANKVISYNAATNVTSVSADPTSWASLTATCRYAVIYRVGGSNATSNLIGLIDFGADRTYAAEPFQLSFPSGIVNISSV